MLREFPRFDKPYFSEPEKMFDGWVYDDFVLLSEIERNHNKYGTSTMSFFGWFMKDTQHYDKVSGQHESRTFSWVYNYDSVNRLITLSPLGDNELLFPYIVRVQEKGIRFSPSKTAYRMWTIGSSFSHPHSFVKKAMDNSLTSLDKALLIEGFTGVSTVDGVHSPVLKLEDKVISDLLYSDIPFEVVSDALLALLHASGSNIEMGHQLSRNIINLAHKVHHSYGLKLL